MKQEGQQDSNHRTATTGQQPQDSNSRTAEEKKIYLVLENGTTYSIDLTNILEGGGPIA